MRYSLFLLVYLFSVSLSGAAATINLDRQSAVSIGRKVTFLEDKSGQMSLKEVISFDKNGKFVTSDADILNLGNTKSAFWVKINYKVPSRSKSFLIVDVPNIEQIDCFILKKEGQVLEMHGGSLSVPEPGVKATNNYRFSLPDHKDDEVTTLYLRVKSNNIMLLSVKMVTGDHLADISRLLVENIYIGIILSLLLFNFFLFFSLGDKTYLYYSLYVFSLLFYMVLYLKGYGYLFGYKFRIWLNLYPHIFHSFSAITAIFFSRKFLNLKVTAPSWIKVYNILLILGLLEFLISAGGWKSIGAAYAQYLGVVITIVLVSVGVILWKRGHRPAKYYIYAWTLMAITIVVFTLSLEGVLPISDYTFNLLPIGSTVELLFLAFALGDRYRDLIRSERRVKDENLRIIKEHNDNLERIVKDRTIQLNESIKQLEASNSVKNKLFSIIAHDLRSPFNSLVSIFTLNDMDMLNFEELKQLLNSSRNNINVIRHTLDNLLYWARNQMDASGSHFSVFDLVTASETLLPVYQPLALHKSVRLSLQAEEIPRVYADRNQVQLILRNLIDNAIKFTLPGGHIRVVLEMENEEVKVAVINPAADPDNLNLNALRQPEIQMSTLGTANERGVGLGLQLCHEFAMANGGKLHVLLQDNDVKFYFFLKTEKVELEV